MLSGVLSESKLGFKLMKNDSLISVPIFMGLALRIKKWLGEGFWHDEQMGGGYKLIYKIGKDIRESFLIKTTPSSLSLSTPPKRKQPYQERSLPAKVKDELFN